MELIESHPSLPGVKVMSNEEKLLLTLHLATEYEGEAETFARQIHNGLINLDGIETKIGSLDTLPGGAKSGTGVIDWSTLLVTLMASGGILSTIIGVVLSKLTHERSVTLEINGDKLEVNGISSEEQQRLIELWLQRNRKHKR